MKAFLSHSSTDKDIVEPIAELLTAWSCTYDKYAFDASTSFLDSIRSHLQQSSIFVFFASKESVTRPYVNFEIEEAEYAKLFGKIKKFLIIALDDVDKKLIPEWMKRDKYIESRDPFYISREIMDVISSLRAGDKNGYFVGRYGDLAMVDELQSEFGLTNRLRYLFISGLFNIGRTTFIEKITRDKLSFARCLPIPVEDGDKCLEIALNLYDLTPQSLSIDASKEYKSRLEVLPEYCIADEIGNLMQYFMGHREIIIFKDEGGVVDNDGLLRESIEILIESLLKINNLHFFFVSRRKPHSEKMKLPHLKLDSLKQSAMVDLILSIARDKSVKMEPEQANEIASFSGGFPPSAAQAVALCKEYGTERLIANKRELISFRSSIFLKIMSDYILTTEQKTLLQLLGTYSGLTFAMLQDILEFDPNLLADDLVKLIDMSLVEINDDTYYIAPPIFDSVSQMLKRPSLEVHQKTFDVLTGYIHKTSKENARFIHFSRLSYRASIYLNKKDDDKIHFKSDLIKMADNFYQDRDYSSAIIAAREALEHDERSFTVHWILMRSLIQDSQISTFDKDYAAFVKVSAYKYHHYILGFKARKEGDTELAIKEYERAVELGYDVFPVHRELAQCYLALGDIEKSLHHAEIALSIRDDNKYLVDIIAKIYIIKKDYFSAEKFISKLKFIDSESYYLHRMSTLELRRGNIKKAIEFSIESIDKSQRSTFEQLAHCANCYIVDKDPNNAKIYVSRIEKFYPRLKSNKNDIVKTLKAKIELCNNNYTAAFNIYSTLKDKKSRYTQALLDSIINVAIQDKKLSKIDSLKYENLQKSIDDKDDDYIIISL